MAYLVVARCEIKGIESLSTIQIVGVVVHLQQWVRVFHRCFVQATVVYVIDLSFVLRRLLRSSNVRLIIRLATDAAER